MFAAWARISRVARSTGKRDKSPLQCLRAPHRNLDLLDCVNAVWRQFVLRVSLVVCGGQSYTCDLPCVCLLLSDSIQMAREDGPRSYLRDGAHSRRCVAYNTTGRKWRKDDERWTNS